MTEAIYLSKRNIKLYLRNPMSLIFSFVYMVLIILLYTMFVGDYMAQSMKQIYATVDGIQLNSMRWLIEASAMGGVLMINTILVPLNVMAIMVQDISDKRFNSFLVCPISRDKLVYGYWLAPFVVGTLVNIICLFIAQGFIVANGGSFMNLISTMIMIGLITANVFSSTSFLFLITLFIQSASVYNTLTGILSALVGFLTGVFISLGVFPESIQKLFALLPVNHGATLMRQVFTEAPMQSVFGGVTDQVVKDSFMTAAEIKDIYLAENGIDILWNGVKMSSELMLALVLAFGMVSMITCIIIMKNRKSK